MKGVVQGPEDLLYDRLLTMLALGLSCFPISPAHMAVLCGEVCAIENCEAFAALEATQVIVDIIDQKTIISDPSLALKAKFQWNVFVLETIVF